MLFMGAFMVILGLGMILFSFLVTVALYRKGRSVILGGILFTLAGVFSIYGGVLLAWNLI